MKFHHSISTPIFLFSTAVCLTPLACQAQTTVAPVPLVPLPATTDKAEIKDSDALVQPFGVTSEAEFFGLLDLNRPDLAAVRAAVQAKDWPRAKAEWSQHLKTRTSARWYWSYRDAQTIVKLLDERGQSLNRIVPGADNVLARKFAFEGIPKTLDKSPQWNQGVNEWTSVLNRFHYVNELGRAYWATGDAKYAEDFSFLIRSWIDKNPVPKDISTFGKLGEPWRALEDGLRTQSWLEGMNYFLGAPQFDAQTQYEMTRSFVEHARYMRAVTIGRGYRPGNWQIIEATGLASIGIMFPEFRESQSWRARGFQTLITHMERGVYPDGAMHELTPGYHMAVTEQFLKIALLARKNGYEVPGLLDRHEKMYEFIMVMSQPDRVITPVGSASKTAIARFMADGALLYNRADMRFLAGDTAPSNWVWTFGPDAFAQFDKMTPNRPAFTSILLPDSKYATLRSGWNTDDKYMLFDMAPWGGGHSQQDRLQVTAYDGRDLLVDPGQFSYDQPLSNYFRSSAAHNIVMVDGQEQPNVNPKVLAWETSAEADFSVGSIEDKKVKHQRSVLFLRPDYWIVVDHVSAKDEAEHEVTRLFHFAPTTVVADGNRVRSDFEKGKNISIQTGDGATLEVRQGWYPVSKQEAKEYPVAAFTTKSRLPLTLSTVLTTANGAAPAPTVQNLPSKNAQMVHLLVTFADGQRDEVLIAAEPTELQLNEVKGIGRALYVRRGVTNVSRVIGAKPYVASETVANTK